MRYFRHTADDIHIWIDRCWFEAEHGRIDLAVERHAVLGNEFPDDPHIVYDEGLLRQTHLGQGQRAYSLYERAYELASRQSAWSTRWFAACNATALAPDDQQYRRWASLASSLSPRGHSDRIRLAHQVNLLDQGVPYHMLLLQLSQESDNEQEWGSSAAALEVAIQAGDHTAQDKAKLHRLRAERLRGLDQAAEKQRQTLSEAFPPEQRLALLDGLEEIDRAIGIDPHDAICWNLRAAWCSLLGRHADAIASAERAIALRPSGYSRPWMNKAQALRDSGRDTEAIDCAQKALAQAEQGGFGDDVQRARQAIRLFSEPRQVLTLTDLLPVTSGIVRAAVMLAQEALGRGNAKIRSLANGLIVRARRVNREQSVAYVPLVAQLLSDFMPEIAFLVIWECLGLAPELYRKCLNAAQYLLAHTEGIQQRDVSRFLALNLLVAAPGGAEQIRRTYREAILEPTAEAAEPMSQVDGLLRLELARMNPQFPHLIADQEPLTDAEIARGRDTFERNFVGDAHEFETAGTHVWGGGWASAFDSTFKMLWQRLLAATYDAWIKVRGS